MINWIIANKQRAMPWRGRGSWPVSSDRVRYRCSCTESMGILDTDSGRCRYGRRLCSGTSDSRSSKCHVVAISVGNDFEFLIRYTPRMHLRHVGVLEQLTRRHERGASRLWQAIFNTNADARQSVHNAAHRCGVFECEHYGRCKERFIEMYSPPSYCARRGTVRVLCSAANVVEGRWRVSRRSAIVRADSRSSATPAERQLIILVLSVDLIVPTRLLSSAPIVVAYSNDGHINQSEPPVMPRGGMNEALGAISGEGHRLRARAPYTTRV